MWPATTTTRRFGKSVGFFLFDILRSVNICHMLNQLPRAWKTAALARRCWESDLPGPRRGLRAPAPSERASSPAWRAAVRKPRWGARVGPVRPRPRVRGPSDVRCASKQSPATPCRPSMVAVSWFRRKLFVRDGEQENPRAEPESRQCAPHVCVPVDVGRVPPRFKASPWISRHLDNCRGGAGRPAERERAHV